MSVEARCNVHNKHPIKNVSYKRNGLLERSSRRPFHGVVAYSTRGYPTAVYPMGVYLMGGYPMGGYYLWEVIPVPLGRLTHSGLFLASQLMAAILCLCCGSIFMADYPSPPRRVSPRI